MIGNSKIKKLIIASGIAVGAAFVGMGIIAKKKQKDSVYENDPEQKNPLEGKKVIFVPNEDEPENADGARGHLEAVGDSDYHPGFYDKYAKRVVDILLSGMGLIVLSPLLLGISIAIKIDDPGPVLFTQKRMGQNKKYFKLHKFRSMKMCTPHDVPTHMLDNPEQYITRVGKFCRLHSLDELPQIWDIFVGNMSVIGPRPGLWNQDILTAEREKYGANDVKPGLTGWAQINGRDELEIPDKAKLDGEYVQKMGLAMDAKVFLGSLHVFSKDDSVVEGGTGEIKKSGKKSVVCRHYTDSKSDEELIGNIGFGESVEVDKAAHKKVLITGAGSYLGESFAAYAKENYSLNFDIESIDMIDGTWRDCDFAQYDIVYHVAGIAHSDVGNVDDATKEKYYAVNTDLAVEVCKKAKAEGVKEFIFMSSMIVYGDSAPYGRSKVVDERTVPAATNFYGDSKLQADVAVREMADENFKVFVLRPPMIYGKNSKGNYPTLAKLARKLSVFPDVDNQRSMLHIDNLCEFLCQIMLVKEAKENEIVLFPQNAEWTKTTDMVKEIAAVSGKKIVIMGIMKPAVSLGGKMPGKIGGLVNKAFGNSAYAHEMSIYDGLEYQKISLKESIERTEGSNTKKGYSYPDVSVKYSVLMSVYKNDKPEFLEMAVDSIINQSLAPNQIVMVIDGPIPDDLNNMVCKYEEDNILFTVIRLEKNGGLGNALNHGLKVCRNELVARMDSDDISFLDRCEKQVNYFINNPQTGILGAQINEFIGDIENVVSMRKVPTTLEGIRKFAKRRSPFNHPTVMFRKSVIEYLGGYPTLGRKEDLGLFIAAANRDIVLANLDEVLLYYRTNEDNLQRRKNWINCKEYIQVMHGFYKDGYIGMSDMAYVFVGQMAMYLMPNKVVELISDKFLRDKE